MDVTRPATVSPPKQRIEMRKKKPTPDDVCILFGEREKLSGRSPKGPEDVQGRLEELIKHSQTWMRRCDEIWFFRGSPLVEDGIGALDSPHLPELYDEAISVVQWLAGYAQEAEKRLKKGQRLAKRRQRAAADAGKAPTKKKRSSKVAAKKQPKKSTQEEMDEYFPGVWD